MSQLNLLHASTTEAIIQSFYHVYNTLGYGFLEKVYENSMRIALTKTGLAVEQQLPIEVFFEGEAAGKYFADLLVDNKVVVDKNSTSNFARKRSPIAQLSQSHQF